MDKCATIKANGERCKGSAIPGSSYCWAHDPANAPDRARNAAKGGKTGGKGRPGAGGELADIKDLLADMVEQIQEGTLDNSKVWAINALLNTKIRVIELERKVKETEELAARIEQLEQAQEQGAKGDKWAG